MPIHDWTRVPSGLFHHFHQEWTVEITRTLNRGLLPDGYFAFVEQRTGGPEPDVIAVDATGSAREPQGGGVMLAERPKTRLVLPIESDDEVYARKANRITIRHQLGKVVAVIEIVSPGNKDGRDAFESFVGKAVSFLRSGVNLLVVDLFPPTSRDPQGLHKAIVDSLHDQPYNPPPDKPLTLVSYSTSYPRTAYIEPVAVGDSLPAMPLFLDGSAWVSVPLDVTYDATWSVCPAPIRALVTAPTPETP